MTGLAKLLAVFGCVATSASLAFSEGKIYYTHNGFFGISGEIRRANLDGSNVETVLSADSGIGGLAIDRIASKVYWSNNSMIHRAGLDGSNAEIVIAGHSAHRMDVDPYGQKIYWIKGIEDHRLWRANLDGTGIEIVFQSSAYNPVDLELDVDGGKVYFTSVFSNETLRRADLDGSNLEVLSSIPYLGALGVDLVEDKVYFHEQKEWWAYRSNLDGSETQGFYLGMGISDLEVDAAEEQWYVLLQQAILRGPLFSSSATMTLIVQDTSLGNDIELLIGASCGDGVVDPEEQCDDGNTEPADGCEPDCTVTPPAVPAASAGPVLLAALLVMLSAAAIRRRK